MPSVPFGSHLTCRAHVEFEQHPRHNQQEEELNKPGFIIEAASVKLRRVLMTTGATMVGHLPLALVTGAGAE
jgi:multidrug efflux pump